MMSKGRVFQFLLDFILLCSLYILLNLKLNVKNVNINVDNEVNDCPIK